MSYNTIAVGVDHSVATITFNRPETLNAFNDQMIAETIMALKEVGRSEGIRCVILTGKGRAFSSGQDLNAIQLQQGQSTIADHLRSGFNLLVTQITELEKPVIGAINGVAAGAGCAIALATDIRIASHTASFLLAFSRIGLAPDSGASWTLPRLVGYARAFEMAVSGEQISAERALDWGLINQIAPADQLTEVVAAWASLLAEGPTLAIGLTKRALRHSANCSLSDALAYEAHLQQIAAESHDFVEGVQAFREKRAAKFTGK